MAWRTTTDPRDVFVTIRLTASEAADLDWLVAHTGRRRSTVARWAISRVVASERKKAASSK